LGHFDKNASNYTKGYIKNFWKVAVNLVTSREDHL
jgi:hypothetical protein